MHELFSKPKPEFDIGNNKKYKVKAIKNSAIYAKKVKKTFIRLILSGFLEKLSKKRKYLRILFYSYTSLKNDLHIL